MTNFVPRKNYGALLEPRDGVLHGAGQCLQAFEIYTDLLRDQQTLPLIYMMYVSARMPPEKMTKTVAKWREGLDRFPELPLMPQIGLGMTSDGSPEKHYEHDVASGVHDESLRALFEALGEMGRPFFLRIGYECNGPWNGYEPASYRDAFARVTGLLRESGAPGATVWCVEPFEIEKAYDWRPDDALADWWSVDWFDPVHMSASIDFLEEADRRKKPVMIGESSPRRLGTTDAAARWDKWYRPYFKTIRSQAGIKAFCYINWDWQGRMEQWADWGDSRLESDPILVKRWCEEMKSPLYLHA
ncbi:MAG: hypothetical protein JJU29_06105 [Verrucomicrobia bacterium]|nr:hypothetical protein [Verrucomicrobiota bacterium]MCH8511833.1 hypothetical protein [Kiritimatiellia bacterium]